VPTNPTVNGRGRGGCCRPDGSGKTVRIHAVGDDVDAFGVFGVASKVFAHFVGNGDEDLGGREGPASGRLGLCAIHEPAMLGLFLDEGCIDFEDARDSMVCGEFHGGVGEEGMPFVDEVVWAGTLELLGDDVIPGEERRLPLQGVPAGDGGEGEDAGLSEAGMRGAAGAGGEDIDATAEAKEFANYLLGMDGAALGAEDGHAGVRADEGNVEVGHGGMRPRER
jgi:hypothetical protein